MPKTVGDLSKIIVAKGLKKSPKVKKSPNLVTLLAKKGCDKIGCFTSLSVTLVLTITKFNISKS